MRSELNLVHTDNGSTTIPTYLTSHILTINMTIVDAHITMSLLKWYVVEPYGEEELEYWRRPKWNSFLELRSCLFESDSKMIKMHWRNKLHVILSLVHKTDFSPCIKYHFHVQIEIGIMRCQWYIFVDFCSSV